MKELRPHTTLSHYRIFSKIGAGGMGEVWLAEDVRLRRKIALKVLPESVARDKDGLRRFEQEAFAASALNHPNILTIYEFGVEGEMHFLAAEFIDGETLRTNLRRAPLALHKALDVVAQTAQALDAAHQAGIIHRDIKPENVMIRQDGIVKVLDFGLAKLVEPAPIDKEDETRKMLTQAGTVMGTVAYMSPEQALGRALDARTDIFSLGVVLYEMLTRRNPFMGETISHTVVSILEKEPPPLAQALKDVPPELQQIISRALAKNVDERYRSASELLTDLKQLQKRLEFAAEFARTASVKEGGEASTRIFPDRSHEPVGQPAGISAQASAVKPTPSTRFWLLSALAFAFLLGVTAWQWLRLKPASTPAPVATVLPERSLSYSLTVQKYRDGKPYQAEFQSSGREIFETGWRFKLNLTSPQEGFLYLLNQEPNGDYRLVFPLHSHNNGSAHLEANKRLETKWHRFVGQPGTERFRLVWAEQSVPELERFRGLVNPTDQGLITDPAQIQVISDFLQKHAASRPEINQDQQTRETKVRGRSDVLVTLVELEHH